MSLYTKELFLESAEFPFAVLPYLTLPTRPFRPHEHDFVELVYVAGGHGEHLYREHAYPLSQGDVFVIPPGAEHDYRVTGDVPLEVYNVIFLSSLLVSELEALASVAPFVHFFYLEPFLRQNPDFDSHLKLSLLEGQEVKQRIVRIHAEFEAKALGYRISIKALLIELLVFLSRCYDSRVVKSGFHSNESKAILLLCEFLEQHYAHPIQLEQVCRMCGMSQSTFTAKFKKLVGQTFIEYRNGIRIRASLKRLRETDDKMIAVADSVGIHDLSHFNKLFKQHMRLTPRQYRLKHR